MHGIGTRGSRSCYQDGRGSEYLLLLLCLGTIKLLCMRVNQTSIDAVNLCLTTPHRVHQRYQWEAGLNPNVNACTRFILDPPDSSRRIYSIVDSTAAYPLGICGATANGTQMKSLRCRAAFSSLHSWWCGLRNSCRIARSSAFSLVAGAIV